MGPPSPSGGPETRRRGRPAWSGALGPRVGHVCPEGMRRDLISEGGCQCFGAPCCVPTWLWAHGSWKRRSPPAPAQEAGLVLLVLLLLLGRKGWGAQRVGALAGSGLLAAPPGSGPASWGGGPIRPSAQLLREVRGSEMRVFRVSSLISPSSVSSSPPLQRNLDGALLSWDSEPVGKELS